METATVAKGSDRLPTWHPIIILCHWLSVLLLAALFATGYLSGLGGFGLHANIGFVLLLVLILRVGTRIFTRSPRTGRSAVGQVVQALLYVEMAALLLTGPSAVARSAFVPPIRLFGEIPMPVLLSLGSSTAATLHTWLGYGMLVTIAVHLAGVGWHRLAGDRETLHRMLPRGATRRAHLRRQVTEGQAE